MSQDWTLEAARQLAVFHRAALALGLVFGVGAAYRRWQSLTTLSGPVGQVVSATLAGYAIPEALFPLYWLVVQGRQIAEIPANWLDVYTYIGSVLILLVSAIAVREAWKPS